MSMGVIEVTAIPHRSIIDSVAGSPTELMKSYRTEFSNILGEVFQIYKSSAFSDNIALELLWKAIPVLNQPFQANLHFYFIVRGLCNTREGAESRASNILEMFYSRLRYLKYDIEYVPEDQHQSLMADINDTGIRAVVKEESAENLQNALLPYCYAYSRLPVADGDLSRMIDTLINSPNSAISFQLIPTVFTWEESSELDRVTQSLEMLSRGVMEQGVGSVSFALAERHAENYRYYSDQKSSALFLYNILVYGNHEEVNGIASRVFAELSSNGKNNINFKFVHLTNNEVQKTSNFYPLPWAVNAILQGRDRNLALWSSQMFSPAFRRLPYILTSEEASSFFRLPIGSEHVGAGIRVNDSDRDVKTYASNIINSGDISVGQLKSASGSSTIGFSLKDLAKHMLIVGTPGSGKTTFSISLLDRLWKEHGIPFLVIEPAKNEYRALIQSIPELQVFTPGKNFISPFVFNPFLPPKNVKLETYKSTLKTAFSAAVSMSTPLDKIFEEAINNCYSDFRWLDTYTSDDKGRVFNISDFVKCFKKTFDDIGYSGDARNIGRAGAVRLNSLVNLFDNYWSIPIEDLLSKPTVIELAAIENSDEKALIIALVLLSVLAYVNANYTGVGGLHNVILLEEAHVLLDASSSAGQGDANPSAIAQGLIKRMLAEIRSYGVGLLIADQSPRKVGADVVALTDMKVAFRLVESVDKQIIADSTNMSEAQMQRMSKLRPGEAFLFFNKLDEPEEVITPDYRLENKISISLSDKDIAAQISYWEDKKLQLQPYPQCSICCKQGCNYNQRVFAKQIARRIFVRYFNAETKDFSMLEKVVRQFARLVQAELEGEPLTRDLLSCVKVHFWRKIRYDTRVPVTDKLIENSLRK